MRNIKLNINKQKIITTIIVLIVLISSIFLIKFSRSNFNKFIMKFRTNTKIYGNIDAPIKIIEYTDFLCPACAKGSGILKKYINKHPDKIFLDYKNFPLTVIHPNSLRIAVYAECAAKQGKFWLAHDKIIESRNELAHSKEVDTELKEIFKNMNIDFKAFYICVDDEATVGNVLAEKTNGKYQGVNATPTYFVNGEMIVGPYSLEKKLLKYFNEGK